MTAVRRRTLSARSLIALDKHAKRDLVQHFCAVTLCRECTSVFGKLTSNIEHGAEAPPQVILFWDMPLPIRMRPVTSLLTASPSMPYKPVRLLQSLRRSSLVGRIEANLSAIFKLECNLGVLWRCQSTPLEASIECRVDAQDAVWTQDYITTWTFP